MIRFCITSTFLVFVSITLFAQANEYDVIKRSLQSPINISDIKCIKGDHDIKMHYEASREHIVHDDHTVEIDYDPGSYIDFDGMRYEFKQFHFHTPSEHQINKVTYPLELHMVHSSVDEGRLLVIGMLFMEGEEDQFIGHFLSDVPSEACKIDLEEKYLDINEELLPSYLASYYCYKGSLTTPPYTEAVTWIIDDRIHTASEKQLDRLYELEGDNHRPVQQVNDRVVEKIQH